MLCRPLVWSSGRLLVCITLVLGEAGCRWTLIDEKANGSGGSSGSGGRSGEGGEGASSDAGNGASAGDAGETGTTGGTGTGGTGVIVHECAVGHPDVAAKRPESTPEPSGCQETTTPAFNLADHGCVTASAGDGTGASAVRVFDDNSGTTWVTPTPTAWVAYEFPDGEAHAVVTYRVTSCGHRYDPFADPASWELQGSNDDISEGNADAAEWTTLDVRTGETFAGPFRTNTYSIENDQEFHHYRFLVTENGGDDASVQIAEIELFGAGDPVFTIDNADLGADDNQFSFSDDWSGHTEEFNSDRYHGSSSWSDVEGAYLTVRFVGSQIRLYGVIDPKHGIAGVSIDGGEETEVDLYGTETLYNSLVYTSPKLCPGRHELVARVIGKKNPLSTDIFVSVDRAQVIP